MIIITSLKINKMASKSKIMQKNRYKQFFNAGNDTNQKFSRFFNQEETNKKVILICKNKK